MNQTTLFPTAAEKAGDFRNLVRTNSGWLPTNIANQFGQISSPDHPAVYQQFTLNNGRLVPDSPSGGRWFCVSLGRLPPRE